LFEKLQATGPQKSVKQMSLCNDEIPLVALLLLMLMKIENHINVGLCGLSNSESNVREEDEKRILQH
jgi:hypothetical protein